MILILGLYGYIPNILGIIAINCGKSVLNQPVLLGLLGTPAWSTVCRWPAPVLMAVSLPWILQRLWECVVALDDDFLLVMTVVMMFLADDDDVLPSHRRWKAKTPGRRRSNVSQHLCSRRNCGHGWHVDAMGLPSQDVGWLSCNHYIYMIIIIWLFFYSRDYQMIR